MKPSVRIILVSVSAAAVLVAAGIGLLAMLHSNPWPALERRLHPETSRGATALAQRVANLEQQLAAQARRIEQAAAGNDRTRAHREQLLAAQHRVLEAREYGHFGQTKPMRLALRLAELHLAHLPDSTGANAAKSLLSQKLAQLSTAAGTAPETLLRQLTELTRLTDPPAAETPPDTAPATSFLDDPLRFIRERLTSSVQIRQPHRTAAERLAVKPLLNLMKNAVLTQDDGMYRLALESAQQLLQSDQDNALLEPLNQLPAALPQSAAPDLDDLLEQLRQSLSRLETDA